MTDVAYIKTLEGFLYLDVVVDLSSCHVIGWATLSDSQLILHCRWCQGPFGGTCRSERS